MRRLFFIIFSILPFFTLAEYTSTDSARDWEINSRVTEIRNETMDINSNSSFIKNNTDTIVSKLSTIFNELSSGLNGLLTNTSSESARSYYKLFFVNPQYDDGKGNTTSWASAIQRLLYHINNAVTTNKIDLSGITITNTVDHSQVLDDIKSELEGLNETFSENFYEDYKIDSKDWSDWRDLTDQYFGSNTNILNDISLSSSIQTNQLKDISIQLDSSTNLLAHQSSMIDMYMSWFTNYNFRYPPSSRFFYYFRNNGSGVINTYQTQFSQKQVHGFYPLLLSYLQNGYELDISTANFNYLQYMYQQTNNIPTYLKHISESIDGYAYLTNSTLQFVLNPNNFDRSSFFTPMYYYKGANLADPAKVDNTVQPNDLSGFMYNINRFLPNTAASINNYLNDFYVRGIKLRDFNYTNIVDVAVTNIIEFAYTNNLDLAFTNQIYEIANNTSNILDSVDFIAHISSNLLYDVGYTLTNFVEQILSIDTSSPMLDYSDGNVYDFLTNYYYLVSTGSSSASLTHTNWFNRVEMLLAALVYSSDGTGSVTNLVDEGSAQDSVNRVDTELKSLVNDDTISSNADAIKQAGLTISDLVTQLKYSVSDFSIPSNFTLFSISIDSQSSEDITVSSTMSHSDNLLFDAIHYCFAFFWSLIGVYLLVVYTKFVIRLVAISISIIMRAFN